MSKKSMPNWIELIEEFDEDFKFSDYTPQELEEFLDNKINSNEEFKKKYFSFYNDIKSPSLKKQDW